MNIGSRIVKGQVQRSIGVMIQRLDETQALKVAPGELDPQTASSQEKENDCLLVNRILFC